MHLNSLLVLFAIYLSPAVRCSEVWTLNSPFSSSNAYVSREDKYYITSDKDEYTFKLNAFRNTNYSMTARVMFYNNALWPSYYGLYINHLLGSVNYEAWPGNGNISVGLLLVQRKINKENLHKNLTSAEELWGEHTCYFHFHQSTLSLTAINLFGLSENTNLTLPDTKTCELPYLPASLVQPIFFGVWVTFQCSKPPCVQSITLHGTNILTEYDVESTFPNFGWIIIGTLIGCVVFMSVFTCRELAKEVTCSKEVVAGSFIHDTISSSIHDNSKILARAFNMVLAIFAFCILFIFSYSYTCIPPVSTILKKAIIGLGIVGSVMLFFVTIFPGGEHYLLKEQKPENEKQHKKKKCTPEVIFKLHLIFAALCLVCFISATIIQTTQNASAQNINLSNMLVLLSAIFIYSGYRVTSKGVIYPNERKFAYFVEIVIFTFALSSNIIYAMENNTCFGLVLGWDYAKLGMTVLITVLLFVTASIQIALCGCCTCCTCCVCCEKKIAIVQHTVEEDSLLDVEMNSTEK